MEEKMSFLGQAERLSKPTVVEKHCNTKCRSNQISLTWVDCHNTTKCVEAFSALDEKYKTFIAAHKIETEALITTFNSQIKIIKGIDPKNSICKIFAYSHNFSN
jgi:hypothetical protein